MSREWPCRRCVLRTQQADQDSPVQKYCPQFPRSRRILLASFWISRRNPLLQRACLPTPNPKRPQVGTYILRQWNRRRPEVFCDDPLLRTWDIFQLSTQLPARRMRDRRSSRQDARRRSSMKYSGPRAGYVAEHAPGRSFCPPLRTRFYSKDKAGAWSTQSLRSPARNPRGG